MLEKRKIKDPVIDVKIAAVFRFSEDVLCIEFIDEYVVDVQEIRDIRAALLQLSGGIPSKILVLPGRFGSITKEAREIDMFDIPDHQIITTVAIVTRQLHQKLLGTIYFKFSKRKYEHKLFKDVEKALKWLDRD